MPIKREHQDRYPVDWAEIAFLVKDSNDWQCQECDRQCLRPGESADHLTRAERARVTLTVAHANSEYGDVALLYALCAGCHIRHDNAYHVAARRRNVRLKRLRDGQMSLLPHRDAPLTAHDLAELEAAWPTHAYLESLPDGEDRFHHDGIEGLP